MALAFVLGREVFVVLDEENLARVEHFDPFEFEMKDLSAGGNPVTLVIPFKIVVAYATKAEHKKLLDIMKDPKAAREYLFRGFSWQQSDAERTKSLRRT